VKSYHHPDISLFPEKTFFLARTMPPATLFPVIPENRHWFFFGKKNYYLSLDGVPGFFSYAIYCNFRHLS
jgi:hypothetical protein